MKKKILFVMNTMGCAGAEMALLALVNKLSSDPEYDISLYTMIPQGELFARLPASVHVLNKRYSTASVLSASGRMKMAGRILAAFFRRLTGFRLAGYLLKNLISQKKAGRVQLDKLLWRVLSDGVPRISEKFDLAVAYLEGASTYFVADHVNADKKAAFLHIDYNQAGYTPALDRGCYDKTDRIFTVSNEVMRQFLIAYPQHKDKTFLFRNLLDFENIRKKSLEPCDTPLLHDGTLLVTVGRLHYQKGYDIAITALKKMVADGYSVRWYVLGEGPEREALEKQIRREGLTDRFVLLGAHANPYPYLREADIYVHATRFEGKSIAVEEAQTLGKVIVASNCTGNTEQIVDGYDGILLELSPENLAAAIERVIDDEALRNTLAENVRKKQLSHPEDLARLLELTGSTDQP